MAMLRWVELRQQISGGRLFSASLEPSVDGPSKKRQRIEAEGPE
jgi:hypothetical protein